MIRNLSLMGAMSLIFSIQSNTQTIHRKVGEKKIIRLGGNATTGYRWRCACKPSSLVSVKNTYEMDPSRIGMVGAGGTEVFTITAKKKGTVNCTFEYGQPW